MPIKEFSPCPFCQATEHFDLSKKEEKFAWMVVSGKRTICLKHNPTCPRFIKCIDCDNCAETGGWGLCFDCIFHKNEDGE